MLVYLCDKFGYFERVQYGWDSSTPQTIFGYALKEFLADKKGVFLM